MPRPQVQRKISTRKKFIETAKKNPLRIVNIVQGFKFALENFNPWGKIWEPKFTDPELAIFKTTWIKDNWDILKDEYDPFETIMNVS